MKELLCKRVITLNKTELYLAITCVFEDAEFVRDFKFTYQ
jgi:hypothetical protein